MPDLVTIHTPSFPRCPDCGAEAHELTFRPVVRQVDGQTPEGSPTVYDERELIDFAWRCSNSHIFATASRYAAAELAILAAEPIMLRGPLHNRGADGGTTHRRLT